MWKLYIKKELKRIEGKKINIKEGKIKNSSFDDEKSIGNKEIINSKNSFVNFTDIEDNNVVKYNDDIVHDFK